MIETVDGQTENLFQEIDESKALSEILDKLHTFEGRFRNFLLEFNDFARQYRMILPARKSDVTGLSNTIVPETTRAVETLATMQYAMMTSNSPNFDVLPQRQDVDRLHLDAISSLLQFQQEKVEFNRKLLKGLRTLNLMGTVFFEEPWISWPFGSNDPAWEANDFIPRSMNQVGFAPNSFELASADWVYTLDFTSPFKLKQLINMDQMQTTWNREAVEQAIRNADNQDQIPFEVRQRLAEAGYMGSFSTTLELLTYWGPLESQGLYGDYVIGVINRSKIVRLHKNPFFANMRPFRSAHFIEFELEPYGYGIGKLTRKIQEDLNSARNRVQDIITFNLFHMWKVSRFSGVKPQQLKIRPWHMIEVDDMNGLQPLPADLNAVNYGVKLEEILKDDFQTLTGATKNLQALTTDATATEARITQAEAVRRVSVMTEIIADRILRQSLYFRHKCNVQLVDRDIWLRITGQPKPLRISPVDIQKEVDFKLKLTTDRDFRPKRNQDMIQFLQILTSLRNFVPPEINVGAIIKEIARNFGIPREDIEAPNPSGQMPIEQRLAQLQSLTGMANKEIGNPQNPIPANLNNGGLNFGI